MNARKTYDVPNDRLTALCADMTKALDDAKFDTSNIKAVVMLDDGKRGGVQLHGYTSELEAVEDIKRHLRAIEKLI